MSDHLLETALAWDRCAHTADARVVIHPSGVDPVEYERSGLEMFWRLRAIIGPDRRRRILDFGCGDGRVTIPLACYYHDVWGADASQMMLDRLTARAPVRTILSDGTRLGEERFDVIVSLAVLCHHTRAAATRILQTLSGALTLNGQVILWVPVYEQGRETTGWNDLTVWTPAELRTMAEEAELGVDQLVCNPGAFSGTPAVDHGALTVLRR